MATDFSIITGSSQIRALVQQNFLQRAFHDALFPLMIFRHECRVKEWPANVGDSMVFSAATLKNVSTAPQRPGVDPTPTDEKYEQWSSTLQTYTRTKDVNMVDSITAIASLFLEKAKLLGLEAAMQINRVVRQSLYNAAESGWTVADGAQAAVTTLRVKRLNGFTRARNPELINGSVVAYGPVSNSNPLTVKIYDNAGPAYVTRSVVGFTPDNAGDETGPGTLTLSGGAVTVSDRAAVYSADRTDLIRVGGGDKVDDVGNTDLVLLANIRSMVAKLRGNYVPVHGDGYYHAHGDSISESQLTGDAEFQRLNRGLPDYYLYKQNVFGTLLGIIFISNVECPTASNVIGGDTATFSMDEQFAPELYNNGNASTGVQLHRILFTGADGVIEYYRDQSPIVSDAGLNGKRGQFSITNNGIQVMTDRIELILRAPVNRTQDTVAMTSRFIGDFPVRPDGGSGNFARYKRVNEIIHGE